MHLHLLQLLELGLAQQHLFQVQGEYERHHLAPKLI